MIFLPLLFSDVWTLEEVLLKQSRKKPGLIAHLFYSRVSPLRMPGRWYSFTSFSDEYPFT
jgi:hypothetical protein